MPIYIVHVHNIIESVDSIIRDGTDTPYMLQTSKYLKTGNFVRFLSVKIRIYSKLSIYQDQDHSSTQLYMPEPDVQKSSHFSFFPSFFLLSVFLG